MFCMVSLYWISQQFYPYEDRQTRLDSHYHFHNITFICGNSEYLNLSLFVTVLFIVCHFSWFLTGNKTLSLFNMKLISTTAMFLLILFACILKHTVSHIRLVQSSSHVVVKFILSRLTLRYLHFMYGLLLLLVQLIIYDRRVRKSSCKKYSVWCNSVRTHNKMKELTSSFVYHIYIYKINSE